MDAAIARDLPGRWESWMGSPQDRFYSHMTLDFRPDKTFTITNVMPDINRPGEKIENVADGHWHMDMAVAILDLEHARDGGPIPEHKRQLKLMCFGDGDMNQMKTDHLAKVGTGGPRFDRPSAATRPTTAATIGRGAAPAAGIARDGR